MFYDVIKTRVSKNLLTTVFKKNPKNPQTNLERLNASAYPELKTLSGLEVDHACCLLPLEYSSTRQTLMT